jgi:hypothetical protein
MQLPGLAWPSGRQRGLGCWLSGFRATAGASAACLVQQLLHRQAQQLPAGQRGVGAAALGGAVLPRRVGHDQLVALALACVGEGAAASTRQQAGGQGSLQWAAADGHGSCVARRHSTSSLAMPGKARLPVLPASIACTAYSLHRTHRTNAYRHARANAQAPHRHPGRQAPRPLCRAHGPALHAHAQPACLPACPPTQQRLHALDV